MLKTMTRAELYSIQQDILNMQKEAPSLALLLSNRITLFFQKAGFHLKINETRFNELKEKYVQKDELGNFLTTKVGDQVEWKFIENKHDLERAQVLDVSQVRQRFNEECQKFFSQTIQFEWT